MISIGPSEPPKGGKTNLERREMSDIRFVMTTPLFIREVESMQHAPTRAEEGKLSFDLGSRARGLGLLKINNPNGTPKSYRIQQTVPLRFREPKETYKAYKKNFQQVLRHLFDSARRADGGEPRDIKDILEDVKSLAGALTHVECETKESKVHRVLVQLTPNNAESEWQHLENLCNLEALIRLLKRLDI